MLPRVSNNKTYCSIHSRDFLVGRSFMGGDAPNLADLAVFGVTRSVTCTDTFNELMHSTGIGPWYIRMIGAVGQSSRVSTS